MLLYRSRTTWLDIAGHRETTRLQEVLSTGLVIQFITQLSMIDEMLCETAAAKLLMPPADKISLDPSHIPSPYDLCCVGGTLSLIQSINQAQSHQHKPSRHSVQLDVERAAARHVMGSIHNRHNYTLTQLSTATLCSHVR